MKFSSLKLFLMFNLKYSILISAEKIPRIGIIGGGIGGTSCAFFLRSLFGNTEIGIDIFEAEKIGGRISLVNFSKNLFEEGGTIIHSRNRYMSQFRTEFKLKKKNTLDGYFALYNGQSFVFSESEWQLKTLWNVMQRYGLGVWKLRNYIDDMLNKFERIYDLQNIGQAFETVGSLLAALDSKFVDYLHVTTKSGFRSQGISEIVIEEIIMATIRANYGQNLNIQKMVGSVSVAGAIGNLWSVDGGNLKIPEKLLTASKANLILSTVTLVQRLPSGKIKIFNKLHSNDSQYDEEARVYDVVVLAAPQTPDSKYQIQFMDFDNEIKFMGKYHKTVCTLVEGRLNEKYFPPKESFIDEILTTNDQLIFNSIGRITPVDFTPATHNKSNVWKIFTQEPLQEKEITSLFVEINNKYVREWLAYPHYESRNTVRNDSFVLASNLYYINAIEWAASAMEMSAIGAKNVALLVYQNLMAKLHSDIKPNPSNGILSQRSGNIEL